MRRTTATIALAGFVALAAQPAAAQPPGVLNYWEAASGNWNTAASWSRGTVPDGSGLSGDDFAIVGGIDGTTMDGIATGAVTVNSNIAAQPGGVVLGLGATNSGTLNVATGGFLTINDTDFDGDGRLTVGDAGTGQLIMTGGTVNAVSLTSGGAAGSLIRLSGNAALQVNVVGTPVPVTLGRNTHIIGPSVNFLAFNTLTLQNTHNLIAEITGATHSPLKSSTGAIVDGALEVQFNGHMPSLGQSWDLISSPVITGGFDSLTVSGATGLPLGQTLSLRTVAGPPSGSNLQLFVEQRLVLNVNRQSGAVSLQNPGSTVITFDAYSVRSASGSLDPGSWNSLQDQIGATWTEANPSANGLTEFRTSSTTILTNNQFNLGNIFDPPAPTEFGQTLEDLVFTYSGPNNAQAEGVINYTGIAATNNLVLYADPATGDVTMRNTSPFTVAFDAYTISSAAGDLQFANGDWNSLDDQNIAGGDWMEANVSATRVSELKPNGSTTLTPNTTFDLGELYAAAGGAEDLIFEFLLTGETVVRMGNVIYSAAPPIGALDGDYNSDGVVNAADYVVWRNNEGLNVTLPNDTTPGTVTQADYDVWVNNFGNSLDAGGSVAVPEPGGGLLAGLALIGLWGAQRRAQISARLENNYHHLSL